MDIKTLLRTVDAFLTEAGIDHALIGGLALGAHGVQRFTNDVDFLIDAEQRPALKRVMLQKGYRVFFESPEVLQFEGEGMVDFVLAQRDLSRGMLRHAQPIPGLGIKCLGVEDIIGLKIQAYKNDPKRALRDKADIQALIELHRLLDWERIKAYADLFGEWATIEEIRGLLDAK